MININEIKEMIEENALSLATTDEAGNPHCIAVGYVQVIGNKLLISDNYIVQTVKNIQRGSQVALAVWNKEWKENCQGYELKGTAEYFKQGEYYNIIKKLHINEGEPCKGVIVVMVNKIKRLA